MRVTSRLARGIDRSPNQWPDIDVLVLLEVGDQCSAQLIVCSSDFGVISLTRHPQYMQRFLLDAQRPLVQRLSLGEFAMPSIEVGQIVERRGDPKVFPTTLRLLSDVQGAQKQRFRLRIPAMHGVKES